MTGSNKQLFLCNQQILKRGNINVKRVDTIKYCSMRKIVIHLLVLFNLKLDEKRDCKNYI